MSFLKTQSDASNGLDSFVQRAFEDQAFDDSVHLANLQFSDSFLNNPYPELNNDLWIRPSPARRDSREVVRDDVDAANREDDGVEDIDADGSTECDMDEDRDFSPFSPGTSPHGGVAQLTSPLTLLMHVFETTYASTTSTAAATRQQSAFSSPTSERDAWVFSPRTSPTITPFSETAPYQGLTINTGSVASRSSPNTGNNTIVIKSPQSYTSSPLSSNLEDDPFDAEDDTTEQCPPIKTKTKPKTGRATTTAARRRSSNSRSGELFTCECHNKTYHRKGDLERHLRESSNPEVCHGCDQRFKRKDPRIRHWDRDAACEVRHHVALTLMGDGCEKERARWYRRMGNLRAGKGVKKGWDGVAMAMEREEMLERMLEDRSVLGMYEVGKEGVRLRRATSLRRTRSRSGK
ncbi:hypothetical protein FRB94_011396 [Tulasnella sp. JGI-2019a]|nr:hypothetical protein FRB94_011396 [Tulasnella sp. JGI-2019a]KAG9002061.1 hypothetical protein FRB93_011832 [Tulasnella sp. JGI-2019a]